MDTVANEIRIAFIGGGSQNWAPTIIRDIVFKPGLEEVELDIRLIDVSAARAQAIEALFKAKLAEWGVRRARVRRVADPARALDGAHFVIIAISTGRLAAMRHDIAVPERYGIFHTVGDTSGPGGWSRALRNIPVFRDYARLIRRHAPGALVLNYTNPMGALTRALSLELGRGRVVGLCHGLFECYDVLSGLLGLKSEKSIQVRFAGVNHFFWILDLQIAGQDGYAMLRRKLRGRSLGAFIKGAHRDAMGFSSDKWLTSELFEHYGYLPYVGDRHTCEFFGSYLASPELMRRFKLVRTSVAERAKLYRKAEQRIRQWTRGLAADWPLTQIPSRETAADIIRAAAFNERFTDVVNVENEGQIANLPAGAVVETLGQVDARGITPLTAGPLPDALLALIRPHADVQLRTVAAGLSGDLDAALLALAADPACAHMTVSDVKKMGLELLRANRHHLPQFFSRPQ